MGETGTGKEVVGRRFMNWVRERKTRSVAVKLRGDSQRHLLEAELFWACTRGVYRRRAIEIGKDSCGTGWNIISDEVVSCR